MAYLRLCLGRWHKDKSRVLARSEAGMVGLFSDWRDVTFHIARHETVTGLLMQVLLAHSTVD
eukprot:2617807-Amphidinium_carterae.1